TLNYETLVFRLCELVIQRGNPEFIEHNPGLLRFARKDDAGILLFRNSKSNTYNLPTTTYHLFPLPTLPPTAL
ncbi:MAG: hypothetical protein Q7K40_01360, partial [bacterium]|nr:hypothetical protein [bacterium]